MNKRTTGLALEEALAARLQDLLGTIPWLKDIKVHPNPAPYQRPYDLVAEFRVPMGPKIELWVECKTDPRPSLFPSVAVERKIEGSVTEAVRLWVFAAPYITPRMAEMCEKHGWSWFDLAGNCRITVPGLFHLDRKGREPVHISPRPVANLGTPEAGRVIRAMLAPEHAEVTWTQRRLHDESYANVSLGMVNKVVRYLREEAYIEEMPERGFRLRDPLKLLTAWRDAYRFSAHERRGYFSLRNHKMLDETLANANPQNRCDIVYAVFSAAGIQAPHVRQPKTWFYVAEKSLAEFENLAEATLVDSGENLVVLIPNDLGVFAFRDNEGRDALQIGCTNLVQTYVDLWHCGGRGREAADAILEQRLKPEWLKRGLL